MATWTSGPTEMPPVGMTLPDYGGGCIANILPGLGATPRPSWLAEMVGDARQIVLLVLDGLGWLQLGERSAVAPTLAGLRGKPITSVVPSTTATALTSITTGLAPAGHEVVGYRVDVGGEVLNILRWTTPAGDARQRVIPGDFQTRVAFGGQPVPVVTRAEFAGTGFSAAHLHGARIVGWRVPSGLAVEVGALLAAGEQFVYAYYDGIDKVAHEHGFGPHYDAELRAVDRMVADVAGELPAGAVLLVTADHGQVYVGDACHRLGAELLADTVLISGEGRFRWLKARAGRRDALAATAHAAYDDVGWVRTVDEMEGEGWFGGPLSAVARARLGDVALTRRDPVAFVDPADLGELALRCRHGSVTDAEMLVPLLSTGPA